MPESNLSQTSMKDLVREAESQVESLTRALETLKSTVRRLSAQVAMTDDGAPVAASGYGFGKPVVNETPAQVADEKPFDYSATASALARDLGEPEPSAITHQRPMAPMTHPQHPESEWYGVADGGSWPVGPRSGAAQDQATPLADVGNRAAEEPPLTESALTEAVAEPVADTDFADWDLEVPDAATESPSEALASTESAAQVETEMEIGDDGQVRPKRSLSSGWPDEGIWSQSFQWPAMRAGVEESPAGAAMEMPQDDFRSMVDQVRAEIEAARATGDPIELDLPVETELDDDAARRAEIQRMVEELRSGLDGGALDGPDSETEFVATSEAAEIAPEDDEAKREEARRAVEQMRAELSGGVPGPVEGPAPILDWSHMQADTSGPPVLVVKDTEGRVELANVYELLNRLECGEGATLLNYTPHSVTVGLPVRANPTQDSVDAAVAAVFGRPGSIDTGGGRITVQMGNDPRRKRSEDAA